MQLVLLTHQREQGRPSNTGKLVNSVLEHQPKASVRTVIWQRKAPCEQLLAGIAAYEWALVYPGLGAQDSGLVLAGDNRPQGLILLDATWQEAQKMYNQSPYLHDLTKILIQQEAASSYRLRRNQKDYGLCTAECISVLLGQIGLSLEAEDLLQSLGQMQQDLGR